VTVAATTALQTVQVGSTNSEIINIGLAAGTGAINVGSSTAGAVNINSGSTITLGGTASSVVFSSPVNFNSYLVLSTNSLVRVAESTTPNQVITLDFSGTNTNAVVATITAVPGNTATNLIAVTGCTPGKMITIINGGSVEHKLQSNTCQINGASAATSSLEVTGIPAGGTFTTICLSVAGGFNHLVC